jgi:DUF971 family protein
MDFKPVKIKLSVPEGVAIEWDDGHLSTYAYDDLRRACPCALCREKPPQVVRSSDPFQVVGKPPIRPEKAAPVGNYAIQFFWNDNHSSGIYIYSYLREICPCPVCSAARCRSINSRLTPD